MEAVRSGWMKARQGFLSGWMWDERNHRSRASEGLGLSKQLRYIKSRKTFKESRSVEKNQEFDFPVAYLLDTQIEMSAGHWV